MMMGTGVSLFGRGTAFLSERRQKVQKRLDSLNTLCRILKLFVRNTYFIQGTEKVDLNYVLVDMIIFIVKDTLNGRKK